MSTFAASPWKMGAAARARTVQRAPEDASIAPLVLTYALVSVLIFLAVRGAFSFAYVGTAAGAVDSDTGGPVKAVLVFLTFATVISVMVPIWKRVGRAVWDYPFPLLLPAWAILSTFWSIAPLRTLGAGVEALILTIFGYYLIVRFTPRQQLQLFVFVGLMTTLLSFLTVAVYPRAGVDHKNSTIGLEGIFPQKNICAVMTVQLLTAGLCYAFRGKNAQLKRLAFVLLLVTLILGTMARTGWIVLLLVTGFIALVKALHKLRPLERFTVTWFLPAIALGVGYAIYLNSAFLLALIGKDPSLSGRTGIWQVVFYSIVKRPLLGFGYAAFWIGANPEPRRLGLMIGFPDLSNAENGILQLWLEVGLIGVLILLAFLFRACKHAVDCYRSNTPNYVIWYMSTVFITLLALGDGSKFMLWLCIDWMMFVMADVGLRNEAKRLKALRAVKA